jgi:Tfp pilus assembly protein PilX
MRQLLNRIQLKSERGFTTVVVMMAMLLGGLLIAASLAASDGDTSIARKDQYYKQAYDAAESGVSWYLSHLSQNANYWGNCYTAPVQAPGAAFTTASSQAIPGGAEGRYEVELLKAPGYSGACSASISASVINPTTGELKIRSTGSYRGVRRSIVATFKRAGFLKYLWFTDKETQDPSAYTSYQSQAATNCNQYRRDGRPVNNGSYCLDQIWGTGENMKGPVHTNDRFYVCGSPTVGRPGMNDAIEATDPAGYEVSGGCSDSPTWNSTPVWGASALVMPPSNSSLKSNADSTWVFTGPVHITLLTTGIKVVNSAGTVLKSGTTTPPAGVIYVDNTTAGCSTDYPTSQGYPKGGGCGDAWVHGNAKADLTIGSANDIIIDGDTTHDDGVALGLIANDFVRVYHPCDSSGNLTSSPEDGSVGATSDIDIEAAVLSVNHTFGVDNWDCGATLQAINLTGAIAQQYRGTVGRTGTHGYSKNYGYDATLKYHQPPFFLDPVAASWDIFSQTEQVPSH